VHYLFTVTYDFEINKEDGVNVLGLVVFSVALGVVLGNLGPVGQPLRDVCSSLAEASMCIVSAIIWLGYLHFNFLSRLSPCLQPQSLFHQTSS
jgi:Na+/H+-dicarboxylate symporter